MYEFHGWFSLAESTREPNEGQIETAVAGMRPLLQQFEPHRSNADLRPLNGEYFLTVNGLLNREIDEARTLDELLSYLAEHLPGSWGLLYDRNDEWAEGDFVGEFRVRVLARGVVTVRRDPFVSPWQPVIED